MAEVFELGDQPPGVGFVVASAVPVGAEVVVRLVAFGGSLCGRGVRAGRSAAGCEGSTLCCPPAMVRLWIDGCLPVAVIVGEDAR